MNPRSTPSLASATSTNTRQQHPQQTSIARRLLFPNLLPGADLPPLFVSPACSPELSAEVHDLIALALRAHVNSWWTKLTRYDRELLPQITHVLTHVLRVLEQRLLAADLATFAFCDVPALVTEHYANYRHAAAKASTSYATGGALSRPDLFHQLQPHLAVSADGRIDEEYVRHALDLVLRICLPPEDYAPEIERCILREILLQLVVKDVLPRITQPWYIQKTVLDLLGPSPETVPSKSPDPSSSNSHSHLSNLIVLLLSVIQSLSGACLALIHAYKQTISTIKLVNRSTSAKPLVSAPSSPLRPESPPGAHVNGGTSPVSSTASVSSVPLEYPPTIEQSKAPHDLVRGPLLLFSEVFRVQDRFSSAISFHFVFMLCSFFKAFLNNYLSFMLYNRTLSVSSILSTVRLSKHTLFPNGYPGPPPVDPAIEEQAMIRRQLVRRVMEVMPTSVAAVLLGPSPTASLEAVVEPLGDCACNVHLAVFLFDAILLTVFPELAKEGPVAKS